MYFYRNETLMRIDPRAGSYCGQKLQLPPQCEHGFKYSALTTFHIWRKFQAQARMKCGKNNVTPKIKSNGSG